MNSIMVAFGIALLIVGGLLFWFAYDRMAETGLAEYEGLEMIALLGGVLAIAGLLVTMVGATMKASAPFSIWGSE